MSFTDYYFKLGFEKALEKKAGMFTDDKGNLTTASKVGLGAGALGLGALGLNHYMGDAAEAASFNPDDIMSQVDDGGLLGHAKDTGNYLADTATSIKDQAIEAGKGAGAMVQQGLTGNPHATKDQASGLVNSIKDAISDRATTKKLIDAANMSGATKDIL